MCHVAAPAAADQDLAAAIGRALDDEDAAAAARRSRREGVSRVMAVAG